MLMMQEIMFNKNQCAMQFNGITLNEIADPTLQQLISHLIPASVSLSTYI